MHPSYYCVDARAHNKYGDISLVDLQSRTEYNFVNIYSHPQWSMNWFLPIFAFMQRYLLPYIMHQRWWKKTSKYWCHYALLFVFLKKCLSTFSIYCFLKKIISTYARTRMCVGGAWESARTYVCVCLSTRGNMNMQIWTSIDQSNQSSFSAATSVKYVFIETKVNSRVRQKTEREIANCYRFQPNSRRKRCFAKKQMKKKRIDKTRNDSQALPITTKMDPNEMDDSLKIG